MDHLFGTVVIPKFLRCVLHRLISLVSLVLSLVIGLVKVVLRIEVSALFGCSTHHTDFSFSDIFVSEVFWKIAEDPEN
jgi:hypothetical protein